jgi:hypothetical protein
MTISSSPIQPPSLSALAPVVSNANSSFVAPVTLNEGDANANSLPDSAKIIASGFAPNATSEQKFGAAKEMQKVDADSIDSHINEKPQWAPFIFNVLSGRLMSALKYYNGGPETREIAKDINNNRYYVGKNLRGPNGRIYDEKGRELSVDEISELNKHGGVISPSDEQAMKTMPWINGKATMTTLNTNNVNNLTKSGNLAYQAANIASATQENLDKQTSLAHKLQKTLDYISNLSPNDRADILGSLQTFRNASQSASQAQSSGQNASSFIQKTEAKGASGGAGMSGGGPTGGGGNGGMAPPSLSGSFNESGSNSGSKSSTGSTRSGVEANQAQGSSVQTMAQQEQNIMRKLQGHITSPEEVRDLATYIGLEETNKQLARGMPTPDEMPPGYKIIAEGNPLIMGHDQAVARQIDQMENNSLMAAWSNKLFVAESQAAKDGIAPNREQIRKEFEESKIYKAIKNTYESKRSKDIQRKPFEREIGRVEVNPFSNKIRTWQGNREFQNGWQ